MRTVRVEVTTEDIRDGRRRDCFSCPMARAIGRAIGAGVAVGGGVAYITRQYVVNVEFAVLPAAAQAFVETFDWGDGTGLGVQPFAFDLVIPESWPCRT